MKKTYNVRMYINTFVDCEVEAENESEAIEIAEQEQYDMGQIFDNMETVREEVEVIEVKQ